MNCFLIGFLVTLVIIIISNYFFYNYLVQKSKEMYEEAEEDIELFAVN